MDALPIFIVYLSKCWKDKRRNGYRISFDIGRSGGRIMAGIGRGLVVVPSPQGLIGGRTRNLVLTFVMFCCIMLLGINGNRRRR